MFAWLALASLVTSCAALQQAADYASRYDGVRVLRVPTGSQADALNALVDSYGLTRWDTRATHVDVQVPKDVYGDFADAVASLGANATEGMEVMVMHQDLGASIREESAGMAEFKRPEVSGKPRMLLFRWKTCSSAFHSSPNTITIPRKVRSYVCIKRDSIAEHLRLSEAS